MMIRFFVGARQHWQTVTDPPIRPDEGSAWYAVADIRSHS